MIQYVLHWQGDSMKVKLEPLISERVIPEAAHTTPSLDPAAFPIQPADVESDVQVMFRCARYV